MRFEIINLIAVVIAVAADVVVKRIFKMLSISEIM